MLNNRMANDSRSSRKVKDEEHNRLKRKQTSGNRMPALGSSRVGSSGLRRSARETSSKKQPVPSPPRTRKSERLEKQTETSSPTKRMLVRVEKQVSPSPLRRSGRGNKFQSINSSDSKKPSNLSNIQRKKEKRDKCVKRVSLEARVVSSNEKRGLKFVRMTNARAYRSSFRAKKADMEDFGQDLKGPNRGSKKRGGVVERGNDLCNTRRESCDRCLEDSSSSSRKSAKGTVGNKGQELSSPSPSCRHTVECIECEGEGDSQVLKGDKASDDAERMQDDCFLREKMQESLLMDSTSKERSLNGGTIEERGCRHISSKRKRDCPSMKPDARAAVSVEDIADSVSSLPSGINRIDNDSSKQEHCCSVGLDQQPCPSSSFMDRGTLEASISTGFAEKIDSNVQQNLSSSDMLNSDHSTCFICKMGGKLLCCDGKGCERSFHVSCLDPPLEEVPTGVWFCWWCVSKKIELGVHCVSGGVESIWDVREVEASDVEGLETQRQYLVKYKGLAHVHNNWVPESELQLEAPLLLSKFNQKNQLIRWKEEWTLPHRLVQKRLLMRPPEVVGRNEGGHTGNKKICYHEWLVKWCGLGYEHITWELESAPFLLSPESQRLMREYENRCKNAMTDSDPSRKEKKGSLFKLSKLPGGNSPGNDTTCLYAINKLRDYWHKCHNCVIFNDQERIVKIVLFILSLQSNGCRPFLIISMSDALKSWENEFLNLAPSVNLVVYNGSKETREVIRRLEFYTEGGFVMFQVLLSSPEAIFEDLEIIKSLGWEAVIVDECPRSRLSTYLEQLKMIVTDMRLLLFSGHLKDSLPENLSLLSFLGPHGDVKVYNGAKTCFKENIANSKERLSRFIAYECKAESSKFVEYWVPVQLSDVQLEQYCHTVLSNGIALRSSSKNDEVGALRDILISIRKCCDHPYNVDPSLQPSLTNGLKEIEVLNFGINAGGKLQLLDTILSEIKNQGLRTLILFQSTGGSARDIIGDILDDFIRLRFGSDSYERIDGGGVIPSKKQAALNKFNDKGSGRFIFLLENRACLPSIKLSSVDVIFIFNSDLNPANDLRALQKLTIDSQNEQIKVFRLYSPCTVEEKLLILAKQDIALDSNLQSISRSASHMLLMWGAAFLFKKLEEFHGSSSPSFCVNLSSKILNFTDSVQELLTLISENAVNNNTVSPSILKVKQSGGSYCKTMLLPGEMEIQLEDEKQPHVFWAQLLEGRHPRWKYLSGPSQRNRKRVRYTEELPNQTEFGSHSGVKKRKKVDKERLLSAEMEWTAGPADNGTQSLPMPAACVDDTVETNHASTAPLLANDISEVADKHIVDSEEKGNLRDTQKSLHLLLKPELSKLCKVLQFSEDVKGMVGRFLEYIMNNYLVSREPASILQAFEISLCWAAASKLGHKIDRKKSLVLARQHLNFSCQKEEVESIYSKLRFLKSLPSPAEHVRESDTLNDSKSTAEDVSQPTAAKTSKKMDREESLESQGCFDNLAHPQQVQTTDFEMSKKVILRNIKHIQRKCNKKMLELLEKQKEEVIRFQKAGDEKMAELENCKKIEVGLIRSMYTHIPVRTDKLRTVIKEFAAKMEKHKSKMATGLKDLEEKQVAARNELKQEEACSLQKVKSLSQTESLGMSPLHESGHLVENLGSTKKISASDCIGSVIPMFGHLSEEQSPNHIVDSLPRVDVAPSEIDASASIKAVASGVRTDMIKMMTSDKSDHPSNSALGQASDTGVEQHNSFGDCNSPCKVGLSDVPSSKEQVPDGAIVSKAVTAGLPEASENAADKHRENDAALDRQIDIDSGPHDGGGSRNGDSLINLRSSEERIPDGLMQDMAVGSVSPNVSGNAADKVVEGNELIERLTLVAGSNRGIDVASDRQTVIDLDQCDRDGSTNGDSLTSKPCELNHSEQDVTLEQSGTMPPTQFTHNGVPDGVQTSIRDTVTSHEAEDPSVHLVDHLPSENSNLEGVTVDTVALQEPLPSAILSGENQQDLVASDASEHVPQAFQNECSQPFSSAEIQDDVTARGEQNVSSNHSNHGAAIEGSVLRLQLSESAHLLIGESQPDISLADWIESDDGQGSCQNTQASAQVVENTVEVLDVAVSHSLVNSSPHPPLGTELHSGSEDLRSCQNAQGLTPLVGNQAKPLNQAASEPETQSLDISAIRFETPPADARLLADTEAPAQVVEDRVEILDVAISHSLVNSSPHPPIGTEFHSGNEDLSSLQNAEVLTSVVGNQAEPSNQAASEPVTHLLDSSPIRFETPVADARIPSTIAEFSNHPAQNTPTVVARIPAAVSSDPLQNELERISKEMERVRAAHEDMKLQLRSDCEKEIEEIIAQIRSKYETKLRDADAAFMLKKKELDTNHNKVLMNKILAEAFRSKCMDLRASGASRMLQAAASPSFMQQLFLQPTPRATFPAGPPLMPGPGPSSASLPAVNPPQAATLPVQVVHNSAALFSNAPSRPPQISPLTPSTGNYQVAGEFRAPAPHLQPFRASTSPPASQRCGMRSQHTFNNPISPSLPLMPPRLTPPPPVAHPPPPPPPPPVAHPPPLPPPPPPLLPPTYRSLAPNRFVGNAPSVYPPLQNLVANFDSLDLSEFGPQGNLTVDPIRAGQGTQIVCLSDDE